MISSGSLEKENVFEFGRSGDRRVNPLAVYEEKPPIEDRNFTLNGGTLEGVTGTAIAMDKVFFDCFSRPSSKKIWRDTFSSIYTVMVVLQPKVGGKREEWSELVV